MSETSLSLLKTWTIAQNAYYRAIREAGYSARDLPTDAFERHPALAEAHAAKTQANDAYFAAQRSEIDAEQKERRRAIMRRIAEAVGAAEIKLQHALGQSWTDSYLIGWAVSDETYRMLEAPEREPPLTRFRSAFTGSIYDPNSNAYDKLLRNDQ